MGDSLRDRSGFTLIELSIVLVIIGLIVGGVLTGRDLIHAATLRSVITDIDKFNAATLTFMGKYDCLPGDCSNATSLFGTYAHCDYGGLIPHGNGTCNGDGNNKVAGHASNYDLYDEGTLFWQQLSLAGLVQGDYGGAMNYGPYVTAGVNVPASKLEGGGYGIGYSDDPVSLAAAPVYAINAHYFLLVQTGSALPLGLKSLMAVDAKSIDAKIDDGIPVTGNVQAPIMLTSPGGEFNIVAHGGCLVGDFTRILTTVVYDSATANTPCELFFKTAF